MLKIIEKLFRSKNPTFVGLRTDAIERLVYTGKFDVAVAWLETEIGLGPTDYFDAEKVAARLTPWREGYEQQTAARLLLAMAFGLVGLERFPDLSALLEAFLGVRANDYRDQRQLTARLQATWANLPADLTGFRVQLTLLWVEVLGMTGRMTECSTALRASLDTEGITDPDELYKRWTAHLGVLSKPMAALYLDLLGDAEEFKARALIGLETLVGLVPGDYTQPETLARTLESLRGEVGDRAFLPILRSLFLALRRNDRVGDALALVAADLGLPTHGFGSPERLAAALKARLRGLLPDMAEGYAASIVLVLREANHPILAAALEVDSGLDGVDWNNVEAVSARIEKRLQRLADGSGALYVLQMVKAELQAREPEKAAVLADVYLQGTRRLVEQGENPALLLRLSQLYDLWLLIWGQDASRNPFDVCRTLVPYLRKLIAEHGTTLSDREELVRSVGQLRRSIVRTGLYWVLHETGPEIVRATRREVLLWDLELAQQLLIERFQLTEIREAPAAEPPASGRWPLDDPQPRVQSHLPPSGEAEGINGVLGDVRSTAPVAVWSTAPGTGRVRRYERLEVSAREGVDEAALTAALGEGGALLRATFDSEGRLAWSLLMAEGARLGVAAHGGGEPGSLSRLRWAAARHDFRIGYASWWVEFAQTPPLREVGRRAFRQAVHDFAASLVAAPEADPEPRIGEVAKRLTQAVPEPAREPLAYLFQVLTWPLLDPMEQERALPMAAEELRAGDWVEGEPGELRVELDGATAAFLEKVAEVWDLAPLATILGPDTDLVLQVDDALHAVPVAWLPVEGEPLFRRIRSVRTSLAPALDLLLGDLEREVRGGRPRSRRMLSVSSFRPHDPARPGGRWLHHGQLRLAMDHGYECLAGADHKGGTIGAIRGALDLGRFETVAVCGHGDFERAGIVLAGEGGGEMLWQGDGCDLGGVEWLVLVSCSIGRAKRSGDLDVEGFCVQLSSHRARSVAACRWPVLSVQAAAFANEAVHQYLKLIAEEPHGGPLRARALNLARWRFSGGEGDRPLVGINTAAAFELYGLG
jgi:hypothetical protein